MLPPRAAGVAAAAIAVLITTAGCGQKGPLTLPEAPATATQPASGQTTDEAEAARDENEDTDR